MSNELIKYAFTGGEVSETLYGRSDLEQYDLGLALAKNWIVDYRGGLSTRPGDEFCEFVMNDDLETKFFDFRFNPDIANVYLVLFGHHYVRFVQDGAYVLEAAKTVTGLAANVFTSNAHGFIVGDWVKVNGIVGVSNVNGRTFRVASVPTANTFTLQVVPALGAFASVGAYVSGGTVARVYTVTSPYASTDLAGLSAFQRRDTLRLTSNDFPVYNLVRLGATNWTMTAEAIGNTLASPTISSVVASTGGSAGTLVAVTALDRNGAESLISAPYLATGIVNYTATSGNITINWSTVPDAVAYNIYRSVVVVDGTKLTAGFQLGFIGKVQGTQFIDSNIVPDFTKSPPQGDNPFAPGQIDTIAITSGGTGYTNASTVTMGGGGTGFRGVPIVAGGAIVGVRVINRGTGYVNPTATFSIGTGAAATIIATPLTGMYPAISTMFQQRQVYAASVADPLTLWASRPGELKNFDFSDITIDSDAYEFEVDSSEIAPLRHMISMRGGLVVMSQTGIWQLTGGSAAAVTPTNAIADPQTFTGVSEVPPLKVATDLLYIEGKGFTVRLLSYNDYAKVYGGEDKSILSNHLFAQGKRITSWAFAENPFKIVYSVRSDGALLAFTIVKEEKVFAWTWTTTKGKYLDCRALLENGVDRLYLMTQRYINGRLTKFVERKAEREFEFSEDAFAVDCGLSLGATYPAATLVVNEKSGNVTLTASAAIFAPGDVGSIVRSGGGKIKITAYTDSTHVSGFTQRSITDIQFEDEGEMPNPQPQGLWTMDKPSTVIGGLYHLEGQEVHILADGNVIPEQVVTNGAITLDVGATRVIVGLPYTCIARTLPPVVSDAVIEARRKRVVGVATRLSDTRGLKTGHTLDNLYEAHERVNEAYGEPIELFNGIRSQLIEPVWDDNGQTYFVQDQPLPATILGIVFDIEVGDDTQ